MSGGINDMRTPLAKVRGLGSAHQGTMTFWRQRLTAVANIPLTLAFVGIVICAGGLPYAEARAILANPFAAITLSLMMLVGTFHMRIGMQEAVEDYFHGRVKTVLTILNSFFCALIAFVAVFALLKLAFGG